MSTKMSISQYNSQMPTLQNKKKKDSITSVAFFLLKKLLNVELPFYSHQSIVSAF